MLPSRFKANVTTIAPLVDKVCSPPVAFLRAIPDFPNFQTKDYPPWRRIVALEYDFGAKVARADILEGYEAGRTYIRRYDTKNEYIIKQSGKYPACQRAHLSTCMRCVVVHQRLVSKSSLCMFFLSSRT